MLPSDDTFSCFIPSHCFSSEVLEVSIWMKHEASHTLGKNLNQYLRDEKGHMLVALRHPHSHKQYTITYCTTNVPCRMTRSAVIPLAQLPICPSKTSDASPSFNFSISPPTTTSASWHGSCVVQCKHYIIVRAVLSPIPWQPAPSTYTHTNTYAHVNCMCVLYTLTDACLPGKVLYCILHTHTHKHIYICTQSKPN